MPRGVALGVVRVHDIERVVTIKGMQSYSFNPAAEKLTPRLWAMARLHRVYTIHSIVILYEPSAPLTSNNTVAMGVLGGPNLDSVKDAASIIGLRPSRLVQAGMPIRFALQGDVLGKSKSIVDEEVAFTLYTLAIAETGIISIQYDVTLSSPHS